jgi:hypothetical protein
MDFNQQGIEQLLLLDRKLKSSMFNNNIEALSSIAQLFVAFPSKQIITAALLKLAEYYSTTTNRIRVFLANIFHEIASNLHKLENQTDVINHLKVVLDSNDSIGRALTLRVFGSLHPIITNHLEIHHRVFEALTDPNIDNFQASAAIFCASKIAKSSPTFSSSCINVLGQSIKAWRKL